MLVYHGSEKVVREPLSGSENTGKDYGSGFYLTQNEELGREWASIEISGGFLNIYELETDDIAILDLSGEGFGIRNWAALVINNRCMYFPDPASYERARSLVSGYLPDTASFDVIKGFRADCSYYSQLRSYLTGEISLNELEDRILSADLGEQLVLKSEHALKQLTFLDHEPVDGSLYYPKRMMRDTPKDPVCDNERLKPYPGSMISDAMYVLGEFAEYVVQALPDSSPDRLFQMFVISGFAERFEKGDPAVIRGMSGTELARSSALKCGMDPSLYPFSLPPSDRAPGSAFWCGRLLAYYQWFKGVTFTELFALLPFSRLRSMYQELKDMPIEVAAVTIDKRLGKRRVSSTRLQTLRKRAGLSQRELAAASGVNLRTLQQYETGDKDINRAAAGKVIALSRVMHCSPGSLMQ